MNHQLVVLFKDLPHLLSTGHNIHITGAGIRVRLPVEHHDILAALTDEFHKLHFIVSVQNVAHRGSALAKLCGGSLSSVAHNIVAAGIIALQLCRGCIHFSTLPVLQRKLAGSDHLVTYVLQIIRIDISGRKQECSLKGCRFPLQQWESGP